ncbi:MAG: class I SAM-dependent methyltransferase [Catenulispora sp.]
MTEQQDRDHWDAVYEKNQTDAVSWFQADPATSMSLIQAAGTAPDAALIDVGGGASMLADQLIEHGFTSISVLDVAEPALAVARDRLGDAAAGIDWIVTDLLAWTPTRRYALWHDRAVFHFLTEPADRDRYRQVLDAALDDGGHVAIGTFAADGPSQCSGLPTARYEPDELAEQFPNLRIVRQHREEHHTPWDALQPFTWLLLTRT